jgi:hypothetical protein
MLHCLALDFRDARNVCTDCPGSCLSLCSSVFLAAVEDYGHVCVEAVSEDIWPVMSRSDSGFVLVELELVLRLLERLTCETEGGPLEALVLGMVLLCDMLWCWRVHDHDVLCKQIRGVYHLRLHCLPAAIVIRTWQLYRCHGELEGVDVLDDLLPCLCSALGWV